MKSAPLSDFSVSVDYYHIKKTDVIAQTSPIVALASYLYGALVPAGYTVIADAPYSSWAFFLWAATVRILSLGLHASGSVTAAVAFVQSSVMGCQDRFSGRVSTYLTAPCGRFLYSGRVRTFDITPRFVLVALSRLAYDIDTTSPEPVGFPYPYVSRGPRPEMWRGPFRHDGAVGPVIFKEVTTPLPTAAAIFASNWACISRNCVAHAVDSAVTLSTPSLSAVGVAWSEI